MGFAVGAIVLLLLAKLLLAGESLEALSQRDRFSGRPEALRHTLILLEGALLGREVAEVERGLVPVDGEVGGAEVEDLVGARQGAASAEAVPVTHGAPGTVLLYGLESERVFLSHAVITET